MADRRRGYRQSFSALQGSTAAHRDAPIQSLFVTLWACPLCSGPMSHWLTMPIDCKKEVALAQGRVYRCDFCSYGALLPRPDPGEVASAYDLQHYYTHGQSHFAPAGRPSFLDRVREHLAWRLDRGCRSGAQHIHALLAGKPSDI